MVLVKYFIIDALIQVLKKRHQSSERGLILIGILLILQSYKSSNNTYLYICMFFFDLFKDCVMSLKMSLPYKRRCFSGMIYVHPCSALFHAQLI